MKKKVYRKRKMQNMSNETAPVAEKKPKKRAKSKKTANVGGNDNA